MRWKKCVQCAAGGPKSAVWRNPAAAVYSSHGPPEYSFMIKQQICGKPQNNHHIQINFVKMETLIWLSMFVNVTIDW